MQSKREVIWWALGTIREAYEKVVREEAGRLGIVRENWRKSTDFLRANLCAGRWNERSHFVVCLPALQQFSSGGLYLVGIDGEEARQLVVCKSVRYEWRAPNRILVVQLGTNDDEAKASRAHVVPQGLCENLTNTLKLLANQKMVTVRFKTLSWAAREMQGTYYERTQKLHCIGQLQCSGGGPLA